MKTIHIYIKYESKLQLGWRAKQQTRKDHDQSSPEEGLDLNQRRPRTVCTLWSSNIDPLFAAIWLRFFSSPVPRRLRVHLQIQISSIVDTVDLFDPPAYLYAICGKITSWIKWVVEGGWKMFTRFIIKMVIILSGAPSNIIIITNYIAGTLWATLTWHDSINSSSCASEETAAAWLAGTTKKCWELSFGTWQNFHR